MSESTQKLINIGPSGKPGSIGNSYKIIFTPKPLSIWIERGLAVNELKELFLSEELGEPFYTSEELPIRREIDGTNLSFTQDINKRIEMENQKLTEHIEMFAAAYAKKTNIDPSEAELIVKFLPEGGCSYSFKKKERHAWIKNSKGKHECETCHCICSHIKNQRGKK